LKFAPGDAYNQLAANQTYKKFINQGIIGNANINMAVHNTDTSSQLEKQWIDCNIKLTRNKLYAFNIGSEGTNSAGRFGMGLNTSIQNKNCFRGAEVISLKLRTSAEIQGSLSNSSSQGGTGKYFLIFNTLEGGAEVSIDFPRILFPYRSKYNLNLHQGLTSVSAGAGFEFRPEYKRIITTAAWSYKWNQGERIKHIFTPVELNYVNISTSEAFQLRLDTLTDPQYKSQYTDHLLTMIRYSLILSNIGITKSNNQFFLRLNGETSGNIPFAVDNIFDNPTISEGYYERFGVRYSQYVRFDAEYKKYWKLKFDNTLVFRLVGGLALPYGNSVSVPFEKSFWLGGANDMRGWRLRSLGPGAYMSNNKNYDKTGDILIQSSIEQRFPVYSFLLGSLFVDAGNVWLREKSEDFPDGEFKLSTFYKQIAMDAGIGFRFDFSFFIFRIDAAVPFYNPGLDDRWFNPLDFRLKYAIWNFGIGYPF
jgi:outer membrane protein assembly factor BamA